MRYVALSWGTTEPPYDLRRGLPAPGLDRAPLAALAGPRHLPRPPVAQLPAAQRADPQGPDLRPDRRDHRRGHDLAARDPRRRAQLRLPLQLDPRLDLRALGDVQPRLRLGGGRLLLLHRRRRQHGRRPADHVRRRRRARPGRVRTRSPARLRQLAARPDRQRRARPDAARRLGRAARLGLPAHARATTTWTGASGRFWASRSRRRSSTGG